MSIEKPVQLSLVDGPFHGKITPLEAPTPRWPAEAWKALDALRKVTKEDAPMTVHQLCVMAALLPDQVDAGLRHLAAYECARPVVENRIEGWRPGRRAWDIYKHWAPR